MRVLLSAFCLSLLVSCGDGVSATQGLEDPILAQGAQYFPDSLPEGSAGDDLRVTQISMQNRMFPYRAGRVSVSGNSTSNAVAIGIGVPGIEGSGHWVFPTSVVDPQDAGERSWNITIDLGESLPAGVHQLSFVAFDEQDRVSRRRSLEVCVQGEIPDNGHSCIESNPLPEAVALLEWDADVDLDLFVVDPQGQAGSALQVFDVSEEERSEDEDENASLRAKRPQFGPDAFLQCQPNGMRREYLSFSEKPLGSWEFRARLSDACGVPTVRYRLRLFEARAKGGDKRELVEIAEEVGQLNSSYHTQTSGVGQLVLTHQFK